MKGMSPMNSSLSKAGSAAVLLAADVTEGLDWDAFTTAYFPERRRHDLQALSSYAAYKQGREWRDSGHPRRPNLTLVPAEPVPSAIEAESEGTAAKRLLVAVQAVQAWEGEGGFTP
jgi:hypothetical protein